MGSHLRVIIVLDVRRDLHCPSGFFSFSRDLLSPFVSSCVRTVVGQALKPLRILSSCVIAFLQPVALTNLLILTFLGLFPQFLTLFLLLTMILFLLHYLLGHFPLIMRLLLPFGISLFFLMLPLVLIFRNFLNSSHEDCSQPYAAVWCSAKAREIDCLTSVPMILLHLLIYLSVARLSAFHGCTHISTILMAWQGEERPSCVL